MQRQNNYCADTLTVVKILASLKQGALARIDSWKLLLASNYQANAPELCPQHLKLLHCLSPMSCEPLQKAVFMLPSS